MKSTLLQQQSMIVAATIIAMLIFFNFSYESSAEDYSLGPVTIYFEQDSAEVATTGGMQINDFANKLSEKNISRIVIDGFSDISSSSAPKGIIKDKAISLARAANVAQIIVAEYPEFTDLITTFGHGAAGTAANDTQQETSGYYPRVEIRAYTYLRPFSVDDDESRRSPSTELITLSMRKIDIEEAFELLSKKERVNIVLENGVTGIISVNLFNVSLDDAIYAIAESAGFAVEKRAIGYVVFAKANTEVRTFKIQYSEASRIESILKKHLTEQGKVTSMPDRGLLVVEDTLENLDNIELVLKELDKEPKQILIEAKILEITLDETESFGLDWWKIFTKSDNLLGLEEDGSGTVGAKGLSNATTGLIFNLVNDNINITLNALNEKGRVKTLSTPKLLTLEKQEASVIIGDEKGYKVTTTIDSVTSESIQFLESGIILKVTPSVDNNGRILLEIHPEVSTGSVTSGIPSKTTTEVTTSLLADNGQTVFIGGLLKKKSDYTKDGVPVLGDIPFLGRAFSKTKEVFENSETVVLITPHIMVPENKQFLEMQVEKVEKGETEIVSSQKGRVPSEL